MTMPQERLRSIGWGAELLERLQQDPTIPNDLRVLAEQASASYPNTDMLLQLLASSSREFPRDAGQSVERARAVFEEVEPPVLEPKRPVASCCTR